ncbi:MAG: CDP-diacylglycerol--glycerol-3-phosphate 3-phosphatidyltransferase [Desulfomonilia bacterium]|jgi:CDP-diacylglycerol--glycerol-3-phosphate 3-phosphatidyltransferase|uniref:CDP-diacylglycerol--glycerol-3-phosphate 3-phosphatidyltransferase n=1 Tax=anaerobic digester metagenome TaxID=1263854 RepID=A0A485M583_9ZZZZ|nr:CDP-diacylglycerol--glycerol-3-phosphate 3-phosphatidyltransferase [Pseudomonadota bacterium]HON37450.1 CDP-diacylglycerol--glycerol-3-phosphate 3-phosphatidyltransferase [Deltaproteobacteria bacterium]HRS55556.1 CDP-diacylglycerol--glycerol-3-phosphate 3-phosphatidyltransferase [Desulfomonilia bacterium]HPD20626.1 CDP-diacylglycerol--glycerol-3-phosphate 3-phosphatidyltransferase [Deltaproteobacteria bacterium]HPX17564.1 CDP-diacylglycerol--glycerol-3-phosphate 3-phosphatidyltransferase [De
MNIANALTISRIAVVPVIAVLLLFDNLPASLAAAVLFTAATVTDYLDGYFARRMNIVSDLGKLLDPLADKLLIATVLIMLIPLGRVPAWMVAVIIARELAVTGVRGMASDRHVVISASWLGKYKTAFQCTAVIPLLVHYPILGLQFQEAGEFFLWIALFFTLWSGWDYISAYIRENIAS